MFACQTWMYNMSRLFFPAYIYLRTISVPLYIQRQHLSNENDCNDSTKKHGCLHTYTHTHTHIYINIVLPFIKADMRGIINAFLSSITPSLLSLSRIQILLKREENKELRPEGPNFFTLVQLQAVDRSPSHKLSQWRNSICKDPKTPPHCVTLPFPVSIPSMSHGELISSTI